VEVAHQSLKICSAKSDFIFDHNVVGTSRRAVQSLVGLKEEVPNFLAVTCDMPIDDGARQSIEGLLVGMIETSWVKASVVALAHNLIPD
jgi:hypothetical protein